MVKVIIGEKGAGKTKKIIELANNSLESANGNLVFIDNDNKYMFDIKRGIKFLDASDYQIDGPKKFFGFISGIAAQDFDLETIFIDGFLKIINHPLDELKDFFGDIVSFSDKSKVNLVISINCNGESVPEFLKPYIID